MISLRAACHQTTHRPKHSGDSAAPSTMQPPHLTYSLVVVILGAVAIIRGYLPARRAARIDPLVALREG